MGTKTTSLKQPAFAGGIVSPQALGRTDQQKYAVGLRTCSNVWVTRYGTIENRPGTAYCGSVKDPTTTVRLVPFVSFLGTSYVLEFGFTGGNGYVRPWKNGARISVVGAAAWSSATTYANGDLVTSGGIVYRAIAASINQSPATNPGFWDVQSGGLLDIRTVIPAAALAAMQYVQANDVLTVASQAMFPQEILHFSDTNWVAQAFGVSTGINPPSPINVVSSSPAFVLAAPTAPAASGGATLIGADTYAVASFDNSGYGSPTATFTAGANKQATTGSPITVTWTAATGTPVGYVIYKQTAGGSSFAVIGFALFGVNTFSDAGIPPAAPFGLKPTGSGGSANTFVYAVTSISASTGIESLAQTGFAVGGAPTAAAPYLLSWANVKGASKYRVFRYTAGVPGYIGDATDSSSGAGTGTTTFSDGSIIPDTSRQPPVALTLFATSSDYPAVVAYYQQRLCFANTAAAPSTVWMSRVGLRTAFSVGTPVIDTDAVQFTLAGTQVQPIQSIVDLGSMIVHTANGEYVVSGNAAGVITPASVGVKNTGSAGASLSQPVVIGNTDLFIQQGATRLNDLRYEVQRFTFAGKDLTKFATDLFRGRTIVATAWQKIPHSIVWCVLDNGSLAALTYVSEDELYAWHVHSTTGGWFEQVAVVIEGTQFALYAIVRRTINGSTVRYLERFASRDCIDSVLFTDSAFLDAALTYDGRNTGATTLTLTTGAGWTSSDTLTITASTAQFALSDVGNRIVLQQKDAITGLVSDQVSLDILVYVSSTVVQARAERAVPTWAQVALTTWGKAVRSFTGINHLEGQSIGVLADGSVAADPLGTMRLPDGTSAPDFPVITVTGGAFTLTKPAMVVVAGMPVQSDVQTLPLENPSGETITNRRITVRECTPVFYASRGGAFGQDNAHLVPWKPPVPASAGYPQSSFTGPVRVPIRGTPGLSGSVWIRHTEPTPFGMSAIVLTIDLGD